MTTIRHARRTTLRVTLVVVSASVMASCGGGSATPVVPGADPVVAPIDGAGDRAAAAADDAVFTPTPTTTPGPATPTTTPGPVTPTTTPGPVTTATIPPATTVPVPRFEPPYGGAVAVAIPTVTGWAAFDLHLMTLLADGSQAVSATVLDHGEIVHEVALGERTAAGAPVAVGDRYRIASISKIVTAVTALRLVEQGTIGLDDPVGERLAARVGLSTPSAGVEQITLRMLLTHRSGIAQYENLVFRREVESCRQAAAAGLSRALERAPATTFRYSNLNFCLVGLLIEDLTGESYQQVVQRELLDPLGIVGMRLAGTFDVTDGDVEHRSDDGRNYMEVLDGAGSWIASPTDVARLVDALDPATAGWAPLGPAMLAEMRTITVDPPPVTEPAADGVDTSITTTTTIAPPPPTSGYGIGLMIFGPEAFGHTGTLESTDAMVVRQPDGITWAITVSGDEPGSGRRLAPIVAEALRYAGR